MERYFKRIRSSSSSTSDNVGNGRESSSGNASKPLEKPRDIMDEWYQIQLNASIGVCRFLLNGGIPCGGHDESEESRSKELFVNTLNFIRGYSDAMRNFQLRNGPVNHEVIVPSIRNNIAISFAQEVLKINFQDIGENVFSVLLNELSNEYEDVQISMVLRYVDASGLVKERFVGLIEGIDTSALSLKSAIESLFAEYGLSLKHVRGQSYERLSDMRGEFNGLKTLILRKNSSAYYVPCFAQQLHVVVVVIAIEHTDAWNFFQNIAILMNVISGTCKPKDTIRESHKERVEKAIGNVENGTKSWFCQGSYRNQLGTMDWSSIYKTLLHLVDLFPSVVTVLEYIYDACDDSSSQNQAADVQEYFESFDFVFYLHLMLHILELTDSLSQALQKKDQDITEVGSLVKSTKQELQKFRASGFDPLLKKTSSFCDKHGIKMLNMEEVYVNPRDKKELANTSNRHYYEFHSFNFYVDMQIQEFDDRFSDVSTKLLTTMAAFDPSDSFSQFDVSKLIRLSEMYPCDFSNVERIALERELHMYYDNVQNDERFANLNGIADLARVMVETENYITYPLVYHLLKLALVLPVATATTKRSVSEMKYIKSDLKSQNGDDFLNVSLICALEREALAKVKNEDVLKRFQKMTSG